jgi:hypothetical protein
VKDAVPGSSPVGGVVKDEVPGSSPVGGDKWCIMS